MGKVKNPCPYHPELELERKGRANWYCKKCKRNVMIDLVYIAQTKTKTALDNVLSVGTKYEGDSEAKKPVKDTQINTPDPIEMLYIESPSITLKQFREAISKEVSQAVNKARLSELDWALSRLNTFGRETDSGALNRAINEIDDNIALVVEELTK